MLHRWKSRPDSTPRRNRKNPNYDPEAEEGAEARNKTIVVREPVPFDIDNCTIYLWGMEE